VPRATGPAGGVALPDAGSVPEEDEVVDQAGHGRRAGDGLGGLVLRILEAEELFLLVERHLDGPPASVALQDEGGVDREVGAEERLVAAATARVAHDDDADRLVAQGAVPAGGAAEHERGDLPTVEGERQRVPATAGGRHRLRGGQAVAPLARSAALAGAATAGSCPEGRGRAEPAEHLDGRGTPLQERAS